MKKWIKFLTLFLVVTIMAALTAPMGVVVAEAAQVKLNTSSTTILVGQTYKLKLTGTTKKVIWISSNKKVASVTNGNVKGIKAGSVTITATVDKKKYNAKIKVVKATGSIVSKNKEGTYIAKKDGYYSVSVNDSGAFDKARPWILINPLGEVEYSSSARPGTWTKYKAGDVVYGLQAASVKFEAVVFFSTDGKASINSQSLTVNITSIPTQSPTPTDEKEFYPTLEYKEKSRTDKEVIYTISVGVSEESKKLGASLVSFQITDQLGNIINSTSTYWKTGDTSAKFDVTMKTNGSYYFKINDTLSNWFRSSVTVSGIKDGTEVDESEIDNEPPVITYTNITDHPNIGTARVIKVKINEPCTININGIAYSNVKTASYTVYGNGNYHVVATDKSGNTSEINIKITNYRTAK